MRSIALFIAVLFLSAGIVAGQGTQPTVPTVPQPTRMSQGSIRGKVVLPDGGFVSAPVRVTVQSMQGVQASIFTDSIGQFEVRNLPDGEYTLEIEGDREQFDVTYENVRVYRGMPSIVTVSLKAKSASFSKSKPNGGVVSVGELTKDVPSQAQKEFDRATEANRGGKSEEAVAHLRKAISIYPNFMMAHNDLGAILIDEEKLDEAEKELRLAIKLNPKAFNPQLNLGIVLVKQQRFPEALESLQKALVIESNSPAVHLYLGSAFLGMSELDEAEKEMKAAYKLGGSAYSIALFYLGQIYMNKGDREQALAAFDAYLKEAPKGGNADQARKLAGELRQ